MSLMPFGVDNDDREESRRQQLLALSKLRRGVERLPSPQYTRRGILVAVTHTVLARELRELIAALDDRVPRVERAGEASIARDAAILRAKAVKRLAQLEGRKASALANERDPVA